jgi:hypothetical protein
LSNTIGSALGGMNVAARRLAQSPAAAPNNVVTLRAGATQDTVSFRPLDLQQISPPPSGPAAKPEPLKTYQPTSPQADPGGMVLQANTPPERNPGELIAARRGFEANLAAVSTADKMMGSLFDEGV